MKKILGIIVNPIAGMGGTVGLKGTDGPEVLIRARALGAEPQAPRRAAEALREAAAALPDGVELLTAAAEMGEAEARECGLRPTVVGSTARHLTTPQDTEIAAKSMKEAGADLIVFAGGDGTARNIYEAVGESVPVLGVPAGVKMHSAVYATSPTAAADVMVRHLRGALPSCRQAEVMDIDEDAFRRGEVSARLYGYLRVPHARSLVQGLKVGSTVPDEAALAGIAAYVVERMEEDCFYILGPGTTTRAIGRGLGLPKTLLGVDVVRRREVIVPDAAEADLMAVVAERKARIIVTPIGGQGYIFGRGNQQISHRVLSAVGRDNILIVATPAKLAALEGDPLRVDSGSRSVDEMLAGYLRVITGYRSEIVCRVTM
jgi:predicted polyphosphate/ATP-dependent NAD kinase